MSGKIRKNKEKLFNQNIPNSRQKKLINQLVSHLISLFKNGVIGNGMYTACIMEIKEILEKDPIYFMHKIYPKLRKRYKEEFKFLKFKNKLKSFIEFEKDIIKDVCFIKEKEGGEEYTYYFVGQVTQTMEDSSIKIVFDDANVFFTNKRMIIASNGLNIDSTDPKIYGHFRDDYLHKYYISMMVNRGLYDSKPCFGYEFPIFNLYEIKKKKTHVEFIFYQKKKKRVCEIFPQDPSKLKIIKKKLFETNIDEIPDDLKLPCNSCNKIIKQKHQYCKHCGTKINNNITKKKPFLLN